MLLVFPFIFISFAIFYLVISINSLIRKKPILMNSKWISLIISVSFIPLIISYLLKIDINNKISYIYLVVPVFFSLVLVFYLFFLRGYSIYCINDDDFRKSILYSLTNNSIKFMEKLNKIELVDIHNEINISFSSWMGTGMLKIKNKKDNKIFRKVITDIRSYYKENKVESKNIVAIFYMIFGIIFIGVSIGSVLFLFYYYRINH